MVVDSVDYQDRVIQEIKKIRTEHKISQAKLSEILGISRGQVGNIENPNYTHKYTLKQIVDFCKYVNYPIEKIFLPDMEVSIECSSAINTLIEKIVRYFNY